MTATSYIDVQFEVLSLPSCAGEALVEAAALVDHLESLTLEVLQRHSSIWTVRGALPLVEALFGPIAEESNVLLTAQRSAALPDNIGFASWSLVAEAA
jgi:hypothetical protein